ncbi:hypothetical protein OB69_10225 [Roseivirga seohaensis subsp. aquiponti]|uniref:DUF4249 domain-containing protein n=1 Tax=Roseivirga seohaensis subsp. aquiponti TaxID=1566026 RepID=A0A0L8AJY3_9BACT|nr:DUF4249 domain-containing protein [Roseivirga seohaensis]KOF02684.1 hypothetical protein OB69_10225 [Roseivirga seohaensis subsp. aquiponti]
MGNTTYKITAKFCFICLVLSLPTACIEEIDTASFTYEKLLVVDANISDQAKAHEVRLFYTSPIDGDVDDTFNAATGATVWVEDNLGIRTYFTEQSSGNYLSSASFAGEAGKSYTLFITTREGKRYQSSVEKLVPAPEITEIYNRFVVEPVGQEAISTPGIQFFIDVEDDSQSTQFYRYEWTDAYQIIVPFPKKWEAVYDNDVWYFFEVNEDISECYRESRFDEVVLGTSINNINRELLEVPIKFSAASEFDITTMYSIEVTQRAISAEAYSYYRKIELFNESNGSLFDKQQGVIVGNISSIDSPPDEKVLGYFEASGESSKRVFLELSDLDQEVFEYVYQPCVGSSIIEYEYSMKTFYEAGDLPSEVRPVEIPVRERYELFDYRPWSGVKYFAYKQCVDCRKRGSLQKPEWWQ